MPLETFDFEIIIGNSGCQQNWIILKVKDDPLGPPLPIWIIFGNLSKEGRGGGQWSWGHFQTNLIQPKFLVF